MTAGRPAEMPLRRGDRYVGVGVLGGAEPIRAPSQS